MNIVYILSLALVWLLYPFLFFPFFFLPEAKAHSFYSLADLKLKDTGRPYAEHWLKASICRACISISTLRLYFKYVFLFIRVLDSD